MDVRSGYKRTDAGVIPQDWHLRAIADLVEPDSPICYGVVQVGRHTEDGVPIVAIKSVREIAHAPLHRTAARLEAPYARSRLKVGDVLISIKGTIGRVGVVPSGFQGNISRELARLRVGPDTCAEFVAHQLEADTTQERIMRVVVGTTRLEFSIAALRQFQLPLPSTKNEQRAIAEALSDVDALLGALDRLIAKKRDLKQAAMQQLLTGQTRLPGFAHSSMKIRQSEIGMLPVDWEVERVRPLAAIATGSRNTQDRSEDGAYPFFVRSSTIERINSYSFDGEAVLTAGDGVGTGKVFHYINGKFDLHQRVYKISDFSARLDGRFFFLVFSTRFYDRIMSMTAKSSVDSVRMEMIADMVIPLPSPAEQTAIAGVLWEMEAELTGLEQRRDKTRALKQAMMQELLTGKTRLV